MAPTALSDDDADEVTNGMADLITCLKFQTENLAKKDFDKLTTAELKCRMGIVQPWFEVMMNFSAKAHRCFSAKQLDGWPAKIEAFTDTHIDLMTKLSARINVLTAKPETPSPSASQVPVPPRSNEESFIRGPRLNLPEFDGSPDNWVTFRDRYITMVHTNPAYKPIMKFHCLVEGLKVPASQNVLNNFSISADNYEAAWEAVRKRYDDKRKLRTHHLSGMFNVKPMRDGSAAEVRRILDVFTANLRSLHQIQLPITAEDNLANAMIVFMVVERLDDETHREWRKFTKEDECENWEMMEQFLTAQWRSTDDLFTKRQGTKTPAKVVDTSKAKPAKVFAASGAEKCFLCEEDHRAYTCPKLLARSSRDRYELIKAKQLCINCFGKHSIKECKSRHKCRTCQKQHHTLLHFEKKTSAGSAAMNPAQAAHSVQPFDPEVQPFQPHPWNAHDNSNSNVAVASRSFVANRQTLLSTVVVEVMGADGTQHQSRCLLDSGSDMNFVKTELALRLKLPLVACHVPVTGISGKTTIIDQKMVVEISSRYGEYRRKLEFFLLDDVTGFLPGHTMSRDAFGVPEKLFLADPKFNVCSDVNMLLFNDIYLDCLLEGKKKLASGPWMQHTKFGWIIGGSMEQSVPAARTFLSCFAPRKTNDKSLDEKLEKFFSQDEFQQSAVAVLTPEEQYCEDLFAKTTSRTDDGKFVVRMPFKANVHKLGTNLGKAMQQLYSQEARRQKDEVYNRLYVEYMEGFIRDGHMTRIEPVPAEFAHYLPHHGVLKMSSATTKLRPVCNASSISETGVSLNQTLCVGAMVQPESFDILIRFREKKFVIMSDITQMYRQIWIHPSQRNFLRVLWRSDTNEPIGHYNMNTVTFGTAPAPFLATRAVVQLANDHEKEFPDACDIIRSSFYVDDNIFGVNSIEEGVKLRDEIRQILGGAGMQLCKYASNDSALLAGLPASLIAKQDDDDETITKALGVGFKPRTDQLCFHLPEMWKGPSTKTTVASQLAHTYDPIGYIGPVVLTAKIFMKKLWQRNIGWKDELPEDLQVEWQEFRDKYHALNQLRIERHCYITNHVRIELHGFSDASIVAYGAVIYALSYDASGISKTALLCSKSRMAPTKQRTLARLELCGATLLSALVRRIQSTLADKIDSVTLYCDSTIVLHWIAMEAARLQTFVANRVAEIHRLTEDFVWKHISGVDNPADHISRGLMPDEIIDCTLWWNGPAFFSVPQNEWPISKLIVNEEMPEVKAEMKRVFVARPPNAVLDYIQSVESYSSFETLVTRFARMLRFIHNSRQPQKLSGLFSVEERDDAEMAIIRVIQRELFPDEYDTLMLHKEFRQKEDKTGLEMPPALCRKSTLLFLDPYIDDRDVMRVGGRLRKSCGLKVGQKHPVILPKCRYAEVLLANLHTRHLHPGQATLLAIVRDRYWIIRAKDIIRKVTRTCIICFRVDPPTLNQFMADLPEARVNWALAFTSTAVDYTGFISLRASVTRRSTSVKAYIAVFRCMVVGAIHLEIVSDLSASAFIAAFDRFVSRRGLCHDMFSDNGTCFEGADNELKKIVKDLAPDMAEYSTAKGIRWHFTAPRAPHAGGVYEAAVKQMKHYLKRAVGNSLLTYEQMATVLCKVEALLNSRPLTPISDDPNDLSVLTPGHFLVGRPLVAKPERNYLFTPTNRLDKWEHLQQVQQQLWQRWYPEYLTTLQQRPVNFREREKYVVGDLVLLKESNLPPLKWKRGRIVKIFPDKQGVVRTVRVNTINGELDRHIKYLCLLPMDRSLLVNESPERVPKEI